MKVFVGGPIQHAVDQNGKIVTPIKEILVYLIDMLIVNGFEIVSAHIEEQFGEISDKFTDEEICIRDYSWMCECDKYIAIFPTDDANELIQSAGTNVELGWATAKRKDVVIICDKREDFSTVVKGLTSVGKVNYLELKQVLEQPECLLKILIASDEETENV